MKKVIDFITDETDLAPTYVKFLSLIFLLVCGSLAFVEYTQEDQFLYFDFDFTFEPDFLSTAIAIFVIAPLYMRGILKWSVSIYGIISLILILLVFSSFVQLAFGGDDFNEIMYGLVATSLVLSWLGMSSVAGFAWIFTFAASIAVLIINNATMDIWGFVYVASGFLGLILHSGLTPANLTNGFKEEFLKSKMVASLGQDLGAAKSTVQNTAGVILSTNQTVDAHQHEAKQPLPDGTDAQEAVNQIDNKASSSNPES